MFETSSDMLNLVLSVCIIALTFFLCWGIYYFVVAVQKWYKITKRVEKGIDDVEAIIFTVKEKLHGSMANIITFGEVAKKVFDYVKEKKEERDYRRDDREERKAKPKSTKKKK